MRIGLVVAGGVDRSGRHHVIPALLWLIERLARAHDIFVYVLRYHERPCTYPLLGATVRDLGRPAGASQQYRALVATLRRDGPFDLLHAYWALPAGLAAGLAGRRLGVPVVLTCDSGEFASRPAIGYGQQRHLRHRIAVAVATRLARRVTVCTAFQADLARRHGLDPLIIPLGVPASVFSPHALSPAAGPPWRLIHVANLNPVKDQLTLLTALHRLVGIERAIHLDVVGLDTLGGAIQQRARDLDLTGHVTFHGVLTTDDLVRVYRRAHLAVLSSQHEAAGVVTLEAAACGVPTVGTAVGYVHDWAPQAALAVPVADPVALADGILHLLQHPSHRVQLAHAARARALARDADWTAGAFARLYAELADAVTSQGRPPAPE
ncbi:MAG: glycosyltransferase family 4 protein [Vicinamibacterales bacterium]